MNEKKGLALGGGGSRGSYEAGICQVLLEQKMEFDAVAGTSIGAICGAIFVQGDAAALPAWISAFTQKEVASDLFIFPNQYQNQYLVGKSINSFLELVLKDGPSIAPLKEKLASIFIADKFLKSPVRYGCLTYNVTQSKSVVFKKSDMTPDNALDRILSSTAYYPAFNMVNMEDDYYLDGGYCDIYPWNLIQDWGYKEMVAVNLKNAGEAGRLSKAEISQTGMLMIQPILNLDYYLNFDGQKLLLQVKQGYLEGLKFLDLAPGYLYTFYPDDWKHMLHLEELVLGYMVKIGKISLLEEMKPAMEEIYAFVLGYVPGELENKYSSRYIFGRILEVMGLISGVDLYQQIHYRDFITQILNGMEEFTSNPNKAAFNPHTMNMKGLRDCLVFFHSALNCYNGSLPDSFEVLKDKFIFPYYLAYGWYIMEKFKIVFYI